MVIDRAEAEARARLTVAPLRRLFPYTGWGSLRIDLLGADVLVVVHPDGSTGGEPRAIALPASYRGEATDRAVAWLVGSSGLRPRPEVAATI